MYKDFYIIKLTFLKRHFDQFGHDFDYYSQ
jgi:hypothetical protein